MLPALAQDAATEAEYEKIRLKKIATAVKINEKISIDGYLEEPAWKLAVPATGFIQRRPSTGKPAPEPTEVRFLYDEDNLYVGFFCFDSDTAHLTVNDMAKDFQTLRSDSIAITIDSTHDMSRKLIRLNAEMDWSPIPIRYAISRTSTYGTLVGLENISQGRNLKVTPFVTAGITQARPANNPSGDFNSDHKYVLCDRDNQPGTQDQREWRSRMGGILEWPADFLTWWPLFTHSTPEYF